MLRIKMLPGEYVAIGDNVKVYYDHLSTSKQLTLSFDAPREVKILRQKVYEEIQGEKEELIDFASIRTEERKQRRQRQKERELVNAAN